MEKGKTRSIANNYKKLAHWNLPIESYERWLLRLFYLGWIVTKVFEFIDQIVSQKRNNQICEFDKFEDISNWLRDQWAGLFFEYLRNRQDQKVLFNISSKIDELSQVSEALR